MTVCARGCCWTAYQVCSRQRACPCHWEDKRPAPERNSAARHKDPTAQQAIRNIMRAKQGRKK